jgi:hypothetical protein
VDLLLPNEIEAQAWGTTRCSVPLAAVVSMGAAARGG